MKLSEKNYANWIDFILKSLAFFAGLFLVWQIRYTFFFDSIGGNYFEYGSLHIYLAQILIFAVFVYALLSKRIEWELNIFEYLWLGWIIWQTVTVVWSIDPMKTVWVAFSWWVFFAGYLAFKSLGRNLLRFFRYGLIGSVGVLAIVAISQFWLNGSLGLGLLGEQPLNPSQSGISVIETELGRQLRPYGFLSHPNALAGVLLILAWLSFGASLWVALGLLVLLALLLTMSRSGLLAGFVSWLIAWKNKHLREVLKKMVGFAGVAILLLGTVYPSALTSRFDLSHSLEERSINQRAESIKSGLEIIREQPLLGVGAGATAQKLVENQPGQPAGIYQPPHNIFILQSAEAGVLGFILLLFFLLFLIRFMYLNGKWLGLSALSVWIILGLFDHFPLGLYQGMALLWVIILISQSEIKPHGLDKRRGKNYIER